MEIVYNIPDLGPEPAEEDFRMCDQCFADWVDFVTENAVLTRERLAFLQDVWDIMTDIAYAPNVFDHQNYNRELRDILCTDKGRLMIDTIPAFRSSMEKIVEEYSEEGFPEWEEWWYDVVWM